MASATVVDACREITRGMQSGAIRDAHGRPYKPSSVRAYECRLRRHVVPLIGRIPLSALTRGDVLRMVDELAVRETPRIARDARDALRVVLRRQVDLEVIPVNVATGVRAPTVEAAPARFLTPEEAHRLQAAADADKDTQIGPFVALALATGMRSGELQALRWGPEGLDLADMRVKVAGTLDKATAAVVATKNRKTRVVPIAPETAARMRLWLLASGRPPEGRRVFPGRPENPWMRVRKAARLADPQPRMHDLRHTCATFLLAAGIRSHAVAQILGHSDARLVDTLYGHALPDEVNTAALAVEAWQKDRRIATGFAIDPLAIGENGC